MAISDIWLQPTIGFCELTEQQIADLQAHALDCTKGVSDCFFCWQLQKQAGIDYPTPAEDAR